MKAATKCLLRRRFSAGTRVRVRPETRDPDYPALPLGGWAGTVVEVASAGRAPYRVRWNRATLEKADPIYRQLCAENDCCFEEMWLDDTDLVLDAGGPLAIELPQRHRGYTRLIEGKSVRRRVLRKPLAGVTA
jgi:hypothetical protein